MRDLHSKWNRDWYRIRKRCLFKGYVFEKKNGVSIGGHYNPHWDHVAYINSIFEIREYGFEYENMYERKKERIANKKFLKERFGWDFD